MFPLGPDVVEECQAVAQLSRDSVENWSPLFEPVEFNETHGPLLVEDYRLSPSELRTWAERAIQLRSAINAKAQSQAEPVATDAVANDPPVRGRGLKRSKPEHNAEGRTERDLREQAHQEKGASSKLKKRHRKNLSAQEIEAIVAATREPFGTQQTVAK